VRGMRIEQVEGILTQENRESCRMAWADFA
jgi:hypothetical protein